MEGFNNFRDVIDLVKETLYLDCEGEGFVRQGSDESGQLVKEEELG